MRIFVPEDNITAHALQKSKNAPKFHPKVLSVFRVLSALQNETGSRIILPDEIILNQDTAHTLLQIGLPLLYISESK